MEDPGFEFLGGPVIFYRLKPWTPAVRGSVSVVLDDLADLDREEIFGLLDAGAGAEDVVRGIGGLILSHSLLDGFVAYRDAGRHMEPIAVGLAWRSSVPHVAELGFFGRQGYPREMLDCWAELQRRAEGFGDKHGIHLAQVAILEGHRAARRMARRAGGKEVFEYGPIGAQGQNYIHTIWRF